ncbi:hypothetical protein DT73_00800 [Mangrovibacter sp. MFB070]|uniref:SecY-interacting protein n=1 Tax=Mangrovibacter sp. MFB070 TaxID=1224318 RepID=UPI0004D6C946|nr:SecY-interacting protein [Mangrovibacter sp. MFB070]KEA54445.1 hypothetical protein DT73_00800 [Mangrovibacter sp. MFB070]
MDNAVQNALQDFTTRYSQAWEQLCGTHPASDELFGVASPCITQTKEDVVYWQPQPFSLSEDLGAVERAMGITLQPAVHQFYTTQFAGDMLATFGGLQLTLLQVWSEEDFTRVQENVIGHLVTQRRLKLSPTVFIGTVESESQVVAVCNLSGEVVLETLGRKVRQVLAPSLVQFLQDASPRTL